MWKIYLCLLLLLAGCYRQPQAAPLLELDREIHQTASLPLLSHQGPGPWDSYLIQNLPFEPAAALRLQLESQLGQKLTHRGEAHITVITPVEYWQVLKAKLSIQAIQNLAQSAQLQNLPFEVHCLGKGERVLDGQREQTYFVVVSSPALIQFREQVHQLFVKQGGAPETFKPSHYYPHITLGFTRRDLHESDGVMKDQRSCDTDFLLREKSN